MSFIDYFDKFKFLWEKLVDLDQCRFFHNCIPIYEEKQVIDKIHHFMLGLNEDFITIKGQMLSLDHISLL